MNAKKVKQIRKALKAEGIDVRHSIYDVKTHTLTDGSTRNTISLSATAGRKLYKDAKKAFANA